MSPSFKCEVSSVKLMRRMTWADSSLCARIAKEREPMEKAMEREAAALRRHNMKIWQARGCHTSGQYRPEVEPRSRNSKPRLWMRPGWFPKRQSLGGRVLILCAKRERTADELVRLLGRSKGQLCGLMSEMGKAGLTVASKPAKGQRVRYSVTRKAIEGMGGWGEGKSEKAKGKSGNAQGKGGAR